MSALDSFVFLLQLAVTLVLVGLIWTVQIVQYPLFERVGGDGFARFHAAHTVRIGLLVMPLMLVELGTAVLLLVRRPDALPAVSLWLGVALLVVIWLSTFLLQVPRHGVLSGGFDADAHRMLVASNWLRTVAWSGRGLLVLWQTRLLLAA